MFNFRRKNKDKAPEKPKGDIYKSGLSKTRFKLGGSIANLLFGKKKLDEEILAEIETQLLLSDVGVSVTDQLISDLTEKLKRKELGDNETVWLTLKEDLYNILKQSEKPFIIDKKNPFILLMVGVNGVGKTTTIGKLAKHFQNQDLTCQLAAGDTFRAGAIDQLSIWADRNNVPIVAQKPGSDSASVIFDSIHSARAKNIDIVIADTAGRLHTQDHLMQELQKIVKVIKKLDPNAPHEVMLVLDATLGQNAVNQARVFNKELNVTGITLTKLDGSAKGGIVFAIADELKIPIRFLGLGEGIHDLQEFNAKKFVDSLFLV